jgi:two-component system, sensor histidine kinase and response regulator
MDVIDSALRGSILLVEDTMTLRLLLSDQVQQMGHEVTAARDGAEALALLKERDFDLILLDVHMPPPDGFAMLQILKSDARWQHVPVVMISGLDELEAVVRCIELGADDYLHKPCDPTLLRARINACLEKKRWHDQREEFLQELNQNYEDLRRMEAMRDGLMHMIVHDLRVPLTSIISGMEMLELMPTMPPETRGEVIQMAHRGGQTLLGMINDLLDISKMEAGALQLECGPVSATELIEISLHQVKTLLADKDLQLQQSIEADLPLLWADGAKICRVLVNLLGNAIKFTRKQGLISVEARRDGDAILFCVSDTGEGIPREAFARIFEKFGQVETRREGRKMSTGLGLTFCKMAVEAHGGQIWVESELERGSEFYFTLPLKA